MLLQCDIAGSWSKICHRSTVNSPFSTPGGLLISSTLEGGLFGERTHKRGGLTKCSENFQKYAKYLLLENRKHYP